MRMILWQQNQVIEGGTHYGIIEMEDKNCGAVGLDGSGYIGA
jgi:hypothetical protein